MLWKSEVLYCIPRLHGCITDYKLLGQTARSSVPLSLCTLLFFLSRLKGKTTQLY